MVSASGKLYLIPWKVLGPKGLVREPVSKVLILQARGPVQSPKSTLKKKKDGSTMIVSPFWGDRDRQIFGNPGACRSAVLVCLAHSGLGRDSQNK